MNGEAKELRELVRKIERLTADSRIASLAMPAVQSLCEYLTLRARVMELEGERDTRARADPAEGERDGDWR